jgi:hypothetical protein
MCGTAHTVCCWNTCIVLIITIPVANCAPYLHKYAVDRLQSELHALDARAVAVALEELADFQLEDGIEFGTFK